jgi:8-oxo-dGTP pyrophosphatase MutT (NUDIX family)
MNQIVNDPLYGVALMVQNWKSEILLAKEKVTKPRLGKYAGMWSFPMETLYSYEFTDHQTGLLRLIKEEVGYLAEHILHPFEYRGKYFIAPEAEASLYSGWTYRIDVPLQSFESDEIGEYRWFDPSEAKNLWLRQGMPEMLEDVIEGRTGVIRPQCRPAVLPQHQPAFT